MDYRPARNMPQSVNEGLREGSKIQVPNFCGSDLIKESLAQDFSSTAHKSVTIQVKGIN